MDKVEAVKAFAVMAKMQDDLNTKTNPSWRHSNYPWYRALWTEAAEAGNYIAWPWWRSVGTKIFATRKDELQCFMELADSLHFGISMYLQSLAIAVTDTPDDFIADHGHAANMLAEALEHAMARTVHRNDTAMDLIESVARDALDDHAFNASALFAAAYKAGLGETGLIAYYHGKNILNGFRQENGYKQGTYVKNWGSNTAPEEDNVYLAEAIEEYRNIWGDAKLLTQVNNGDFAFHVKRALTKKYQSLKD